jgi:hypothetical protein
LKIHGNLKSHSRRKPASADRCNRCGHGRLDRAAILL